MKALHDAGLRLTNGPTSFAPVDTLRRPMLETPHRAAIPRPEAQPLGPTQATQPAGRTWRWYPRAATQLPSTASLGHLGRRDRRGRGLGRADGRLVVHAHPDARS